MKKCPKCGLTFNDDVKFCSECGEKLVEVKCCPKCGSPVSDDDKFCKACGEKLTKEVETPKQEIVEKKEEKNPAPKKEIAPEGKEKAKKIINIIIASICLFALTFITIGVFGDIMETRSSYTENSYVGLEYFFKTYPESLEQIRVSTSNSIYYKYSLFMFVVESILYFSGIIACLVLSVFAIIKNIKAIINKEEPNIKLTFAAGASMLPIMLFLAARMYSNLAGLTSVDFGWGAGMIIAGLVFVFVASSVKSISNAFIEKENIASAFIKTIASFLLFIYVFNAFFPLSIVKSSSDYGGATIHVSGILFAESVLLRTASTSTSLTRTDVAILATGFTSFLFALTGIAFLFLAYKSSLANKRTTPVVYTCVSYFVLIITAILSVVSAKLMYPDTDTIKYTTRFDSGVITALVFLQFVIAGLIVSAAITKKKAE